MVCACPFKGPAVVNQAIGYRRCLGPSGFHLHAFRPCGLRAPLSEESRCCAAKLRWGYAASSIQSFSSRLTEALTFLPLSSCNVNQPHSTISLRGWGSLGREIVLSNK